MADDVDVARKNEESERSRGISAVLARMGRGLPECACGEPISPLRQKYGAERCMDCQEAYERANSTRM